MLIKRFSHSNAVLTFCYIDGEWWTLSPEVGAALGYNRQRELPGYVRRWLEEGPDVRYPSIQERMEINGSFSPRYRLEFFALVSRSGIEALLSHTRQPAAPSFRAWLTSTVYPRLEPALLPAHRPEPPPPPAPAPRSEPAARSLTFEDRALLVIEYKGRPVWMARDIGRALDYAEDGKPLVRAITQKWADEFLEGVDFITLEGDDLRFLKTTLEGLGTD